MDNDIGKLGWTDNTIDNAESLRDSCAAIAGLLAGE